MSSLRILSRKVVSVMHLKILISVVLRRLVMIASALISSTGHYTSFIYPYLAC